ncbi:MAG TPA: hypothetical protein DD732_03615 [Rhizobiales bacterium]|nr:hypothetical protein [Hyphomicrobiales bacterium]
MSSTSRRRSSTAGESSSRKYARPKSRNIGGDTRRYATPGTGELIAREPRQRRLSAEAADHQKLVAQFTPRELEVLRLMAEGLDTATMADHLGIAAHTVQWHVRHVIEKLRVHSKLQAVIEGARKGLIAF